MSCSKKQINVSLLVTISNFIPRYGIQQEEKGLPTNKRGLKRWVRRHAHADTADNERPHPPLVPSPAKIRNLTARDSPTLRKGPCLLWIENGEECHERIRGEIFLFSLQVDGCARCRAPKAKAKGETSSPSSSSPLSSLPLSPGRPVGQEETRRGLGGDWEETGRGLTCMRNSGGR